MLRSLRPGKGKKGLLPESLKILSQVPHGVLGVPNLGGVTVREDAENDAGASSACETVGSRAGERSKVSDSLLHIGDGVSFSELSNIGISEKDLEYRAGLEEKDSVAVDDEEAASAEDFFGDFAPSEDRELFLLRLVCNVVSCVESAGSVSPLTAWGSEAREDVELPLFFLGAFLGASSVPLMDEFDRSFTKFDIGFDSVVLGSATSGAVVGELDSGALGEESSSHCSSAIVPTEELLVNG